MTHRFDSLSDQSRIDCIIEESVNYANKDETADFIVTIGKELSSTLFTYSHEIRCHKSLLVSSSPYLAHHIEVEESERWGQRESRSGLPSVQLSGIRANIFEVMIAHIYGCKLELSRLDYVQLIRLLESSHLFGLSSLAENVGQYLETHLNCENILMLTQLASQFSVTNFIEICINFLTSNCEELLRTSNFLKSLTEEQLIYITCDLGDNLYINEIDVYNAVIQWTQIRVETEARCRELISKCVRFELISEQEFHEHILTTDHRYYSIEQYCADKKTFARNRQRKRRILDTNFVDAHQTTITHKSEDGLVNYTEQLRHISVQGLLNQHTYRRLSSFPYVINRIDSENFNDYFLIDFGKVRLINNINVHLFDNCIETVSGKYSFSYYIESSKHENRNYYKVVDHCGYRCRSKQTIYFFAREIRFIRVVGLTTYVDLQPEHREPYMYIRSLSCQLTRYQFDIFRGFWTPDTRMTSNECGCCLNNGMNEPDYEWQTDNARILSTTQLPNHYSYHIIPRSIGLFNKNYIMVQLAQPIFSNHLLLTALNDGNYRYRIWFARRDPETDFLDPIRDKEIEARDDIVFGFEYTCLQFIKISGYQQNVQRFKCSQLIIP